MNAEPTTKVILGILTGLGKITKEEADDALDAVTRAYSGMPIDDVNISDVAMVVSLWREEMEKERND